MLLTKADPEKEKRALDAERLRIERRRLASDARRADARAAEAAQRDRDETTRAERDRQRAETRDRWRTRLQVASRLSVMSVTNVGVNAVAVAGQFLVFHALTWPLMLAVLGAAIVESVGVYVSWHAHVARREGDSAWATRMMSYLIGAAAGYLNYTHVPLVPELFAACSLASPWLWSMHSRHLHRKDLRDKGLIDPAAPKFSPLRWLLHLPETFAAFRWAVGEGEQSPTVAVQAVRERCRVEMTWRSVVQAQGAVIDAQRSQLQLTLTRMASLAEETRGLRPDAAKAMHDAAVFINSVGTGLLPHYQPPLSLAPAADQPSQKPTAETQPQPRYRTRLRSRYRTPYPTTKRTTKRTGRRPAGPVAAPDRPDQKPATDAPAPVRRERTKRTSRTKNRSAVSGPADRVNELLPLGERIAHELKRTGRRLTRRTLQTALREAGQTASTKVANDLVRLLSEADQPGQRTGRPPRKPGPRTGPADQPGDRTSEPDHTSARTTATTGDAA
ncbi:hypothetical protein AB0L53_31550 [Nonomuraea sp. NPDC052129]|uniref:hypothetical protein n=1 Tax=Nonomuraea sp. NPDC052129 TaxID=3154651 RepID=UPI0034418BFB